ncbi:MAG: hypothetical protein LBD15_03735 [Holosporales bacterium]|jgi:methionyl-tRNA formyltransferase|nr:hypothetical protein [Holosporales bacterium]
MCSGVGEVLVCDFSIILSDSARARSYIQQLCAHSLFPKEILLMPGEWTPPENVVSSEQVHFDVRKPVQETVKEYNLEVIPCQTQDINSEDTVKKIKDSSGKFVVLAGGGGQILKKEILSQGVPILHIHPGLVPQFKGSTTIYYSILAEGKVGASAFFVNEQIDEGPVILKREFDLPRGINLDYVFDPEIRGLTLIDAIKQLTMDMTVEKQIGGSNFLPYFIIHPVLKTIALLKL